MAIKLTSTAAKRLTGTQTKRRRQESPNIVHDAAIRQYKVTPTDPAQDLATVTRRYLGLLNLHAERWNDGECMEVVTVRAALRNLLERLGRNHV